MIEQMDRPSLPLCRYCGERLKQVDGGLEAVYGDWSPQLEPSPDRCRGRRIHGKFEFEEHVISTLGPLAAP